MNYFVKEPNQKAQGAVIWMHGLGSDGDDMAGLVEQLAIGHLPLRHVFLNAPIIPVTLNGGMPMPAWFDIFGLDMNARVDINGISLALQSVLSVIEQQVAEGLPTSQIFLAGFSQGGALALLTALQLGKPLAGVIALSAFLPLTQEWPANLPKNTALFMGYGSQDPMVSPSWTKQTINHLEEMGYNQISQFEYPMPHSICMQEIRDLSEWLDKHVKGD